MQILSLSLKNFKIYHDRHFEFQPGVNAICGENGAGKTSMIEGIAWVLFNYTGAYTKDELRRQGTTQTEVTVSFISAFDGRTYRVQRQSSKSKAGTYIVFDPQLNLKVDGIHRLEDALAWLQQHLGVPLNSNLPPAKYLPKLFGEVIGIPQGTFAVDFLKPKEKRKEIFDPILQVEEYKQAYKNSAAIENFAELQVRQIAYEMQSYRDRLQDWDSLRQQFSQAQEQWDQDQRQLVTLQQQVTAKEQVWLELRQQAETLQQLHQTLEQCHWQIQQQQQQERLYEEACQRSQSAVVICDQERSTYQTYLALQSQLKELHQRRQQRDKLLQQRSTLEREQQQKEVQQAQIQAQLEQINQSRQALVALDVPLQQQQRLEDQRQDLIAQLQQLKLLEGQQRQGQQQERSLQKQLHQLETEIQRLEALGTIATTLPELEAQRERLQQQIAHRQAAQQFYGELQHLLTNGKQGQEEYHAAVLHARGVLRSLQESLPLCVDSLREIETTLDSGWQLQQNQLEALQHIVQDLSPQINETQLKTQLKQVDQQFKTAQQAQLQQAKLPPLTQQVQQFRTELEGVRQQNQQWDTALQNWNLLHQQYERVQHELQALGDPLGRSQFLQQQLQQEPHLQVQQAQLQQSILDVQTQVSSIVAALDTYGDLESLWQQQSQQLQQAEAGYRRYLQQEQIAQLLPQQEAALQQTRQSLGELQAQYQTEYDRYQQQQQHYSPEILQAAEQDYQTLRSQRDYLKGTLPGKQQTLQRLQEELAQRSLWSQEHDRLQGEHEQKQTIYQFLKDARTIYNQSGPRITRYYLEEIRLEADRLFRELMNRPGMALNWTEDYEIQVQEESTWRNFRTLSGGEQTAAALAVRLALLKVLAELDVAFFDEPTTNLDHDRREQLADALAHLKSFRQLFVISHDNTFENLTENVIRVERLF